MIRTFAFILLVVFGVESDQRADAIKHARIWTATNVASMNLKAGPQGAHAFAPGETVTCDFVNKPHGNGSTPKFHCKLPSGRDLKVRYGKVNGEVYAQVAASRLMWALGFPANPMYPVKVVCRGCPADPFHAPAQAASAASVLFDPATIDEEFAGTTIEDKKDEGWQWRELDLIDEAAGGASKAERDALKLLAVLMQHSSNKAINQRIVCADPPSCSKTLLMVSDVGKTFGAASTGNTDATAAVNFKKWSDEPVWKHAQGCVGNLHWTWSGSMADPPIREDGRQLLAGLLNQLTDAQLRDLFEVARFQDRDPSATIAQWVEAFKHKRDEINKRTCK